MSDENEYLLLETGYPKPPYRILMLDLDDIVMSLKIHFTVSFNKAEIDQFNDGLKSCGILDVIEKHQDLMKHFFTIDINARLTARMSKIIHCTF